MVRLLADLTPALNKIYISLNRTVDDRGGAGHDRGERSANFVPTTTRIAPVTAMVSEAQHCRHVVSRAQRAASGP